MFLPRKKLKKSAKRYHYEHTKERLKERYGKPLTRGMLVSFRDQVLAGHSRTVWENGSRTCEEVLDRDGRPVYMVFDHRTKRLITALPLSDPRVMAFNGLTQKWGVKVDPK